MTGHANPAEGGRQVYTVDRHDPEILERLALAPVYKKHAEVRAMIAEGGEEIVSKLKDGTIETKNKANAGDVIVTNPGGGAIHH